MKQLLWIIALSLCAISYGTENLLLNGNLQQTIPNVPLAKLVAAKGFQASAPWPSGVLVDTDSQKGTFQYQCGNTPTLTIKNSDKKPTTFFFAQDFTPGEYQLRFHAKSESENNQLQIRIYRYTETGKWGGATTLQRITLTKELIEKTIDFTENSPNIAKFKIAFSCNGSITLSNLSLTEKKPKVLSKQEIQKGYLLLEPNPPKIVENSLKMWKFPKIKGNGQIILEFEHRLDFPRLGGWTPCMQILVNGEAVSAMATRKHKRLLNSELVTAGHLDHGFYARNKSNLWYNLYSPDFESAKSRFQPYNPEAYRIRLDITDLVKKNSENQVAISFGGYFQEYFNRIGIKDRIPAIIIRNLSIWESPNPSPIPPQEIFETAKRIVMHSKPQTNFQAVLNKDGALLITLKGKTYKIQSNFSAPNDHSFSFGSPTKNKFSSLKIQNNSLIADNEYYTITRKIQLKNNRVDIFDTFKSKQKELCGARISHTINAETFDPIYLGGDSSPNILENSGGRNPSVFLANKANQTGIGMIAVDDVFRVQNRQFYKNDVAGIRSDHYALIPGKTQTIEWSIYPVNSTDYFDFINLVRNDWGVNFPIKENLHLSMFDYLYRNKELNQHFVKQMGITAQSFCVLFWKNTYWNPPYSIQDAAVHGFGLMLDELRSARTPGKTIKVDPMRQAVRKALSKAKEYNPKVKRMIYVHNQYSCEVDDLKKYSDSIHIDLKGRRLTGGGGTYYNLFIPTLDNEYGKNYLKFIAYLFDNFDLDGIYHDEFTASNRPITNTMWDGASVELDEKGNFKRKIGYLPLILLPFNMKVMDYVVNQRGKTFIANFSPETRTELQFQVPRFEEVIYPNWIKYAHLYTPIELGGGTRSFRGTAQDVAREVREALSNGALYYPPYMEKNPYKIITAYMYPFTPVELHKGYLVGKERIITIYSGEYGIPGETTEYEAIVFAPDGSPVKNHPYENIHAKDGVKCKIELAKGECAILIKKNLNL